MPQIAQLAETYASQIFWMLLFFGLVFFVVGRGMVPKVMATVEARDSQIAADLAAAGAARTQADAEEEAWRVQSNAQRAQAQALIAAAKAKAATATEKSLAKAQDKIDAQLAEAEARIGAAKDKGLAEVAGIASDAASQIVTRLTGAAIDAKLADKAVKEALSA
ncbi:ATPase [Novosphingobium aquae]|jgi:F-type H+-transporting ATPase subunit b|uniref:ATP synthase subunit b n=1 Tax=Novosphingobium aquae TaxID=3133435 RepID=A0ABU8S841_9SPHN